MDEIFVDDDGDIFIPEPPNSYEDVTPSKKKEAGLVDHELGIEDRKFDMTPVTAKVQELLDAMVEELNRYHDNWTEHATEADILDRRTGRKVSPKFEIEFFTPAEIPDYEATVALHDLEAEESEHGDPILIADRIMSICYFSGYHKESTGI